MDIIALAMWHNSKQLLENVKACLLITFHIIYYILNETLQGRGFCFRPLQAPLPPLKILFLYISEGLLRNIRPLPLS